MSTYHLIGSAINFDNYNTTQHNTTRHNTTQYKNDSMAQLPRPILKTNAQQ